MVSITSRNKKLIVGVFLFFIVFLIIRHLLYYGDNITLLSPQPTYQRRVPGTPILVTVFYETLCSDSKHFLLKQLQPTYSAVSSLIDVQFVAYGKAQTFTEPDGSYRFDCQHGEPECQGNKYHACASEIIEDPQKRLDVIVCMIKDNRLPKEAMHKCAKHHGVENIDLIQKCYDSSHGSELMKLNGDATNALRPPVKFIPTITLDGSQGRQAGILKDLLGEICKILGETDEAKEACKDKIR